MFDFIFALWRESAPVTFESAFGLAESVERLAAATRRSVFSALATEQAVGKVSVKRVSLQRVIPMVGNSFKPFFTGRFEEKDGRVRLTGRFAMLAIVRLFMLVWFGGVLAASVIGLFQVLANPRDILKSLFLFGGGMLMFGLLLVKVGTWLARNDAAWLAAVIGRALAASPPPESRRVGSGPAAGSVTHPLAARSSVPSYVALVLGLSALMSLVTGLMGNRFFPVERWPALPGGLEIFSSPVARILYACGEAILALGIYRRYRLAWAGGLLFIAASGGYGMMMGAGVASGRGSPPWIFAGFSVIVTGMWLAWWYAQRVHFRE